MTEGRANCRSMIDTLQVSANNIFITCAKVLDGAAYDNETSCLMLPNNLFLHDTAKQLDKDISQYNEVLDNFLVQFNDASYVVRKIKDKFINEGKAKPIVEAEQTKQGPPPVEKPTSPQNTYEPNELDFGEFLESADKGMGYDGMDMDMDFDDNYSSIYGQEKANDTESKPNQEPSVYGSNKAPKEGSTETLKHKEPTVDYNGNYSQGELDEFNFNDLMDTGANREQTPQNADFDVDALQGDGEMHLFGELNELESILGNR